MDYKHIFNMLNDKQNQKQIAKLVYDLATCPECDRMLKEYSACSCGIGGNNE